VRECLGADMKRTIALAALITAGCLTAAPAGAVRPPGGPPIRVTTVSCVPDGADLNDLSPARLTPEQRAKLARSYNAPDVKGLRSAIDLYLKGKGSDLTKRRLALTPKSVLRKEFILLSGQPVAAGGSYLTVEFKDHPEHVYAGWIFNFELRGYYEVRSWEVGTCTLAQQRWMKARYGEVLAMPGG